MYSLLSSGGDVHVQRLFFQRVFYLVVNDAAVALEDRRLGLGQPDRGSGGPPRLLGLPATQRLVGFPGGAAEAAVVDQEEARAQQEQQEHGRPVALERVRARTHTQSERERGREST